MGRRSFRHLDGVLVASIFLLLGIGLLQVYSASQIPALPGRSSLFPRQMMWMGMGLIAFLFAALIPFRLWEEYSHFFYGVSLILLLLVPVAGVERLGAKRWLMVGGFQFQPSEVAKLATLLFVSRLLARPRLDVTRFSTLATVAGVALVPFALILIEPDLGTSLSIPAALIPMLYWVGLPLAVLGFLASPLVSAILSVNVWVWLAFMGALGGGLALLRARRSIIMGILAVNILAGAVTPVVWNSLKPYQRQRVLTFLNPEEDRAGAGYQVIQSKIAIGSGGFAGRGYLQGTQKGLAFLPQQHTDFVFSVLGEEWGFVGCAGVLVLFAVVVGRGLRIASRSRSRFASVLVIGILSGLVFHVAVNVSMTVGLAPVTGIPLPFLSYGGTFLLATLAQMGLLLNVAIRRNEV